MSTRSIFEAARNYQEAAFQVVKDSPLTRKYWRQLHLCQIFFQIAGPSCREMPNIFSDVYAGGALMDLGVSLPLPGHWLLWRTDLQPLYCSAITQLVDLYGQGVLIYPDFQVAIQAGKNITSHLPAEIYTKTER